MAYVWFEREDEWAAMRLSEMPVDVGGRVPRAVTPGHSSIGTKQIPAQKATQIVQVGAGRRQASVLIWSPDKTVRVNGWTLTTGIRVLADRDEIRIGDRTPVFYSSESVARSRSSPEATARSSATLYAADRKRKAVVRCPDCGLMYHQDAELRC